MANYKTGPGNYRSSYMRVFIKQDDETVNDSTTLQDDDELFCPLNINTVYNFQLLFFPESGPTPDFKFTFTVPTGTSGNRNNGILSGIGDLSSISLTTITNVQMASGVRMINVHGRAMTSVIQGNLQFQWAQLNQTAVNTKVLQGSMLVIFET